MLFFVGSGGSDYLDVLGGPDPALLAALLGEAAAATEGFLGIRLHHVSDDSPTRGVLTLAAERLGLDLVEEERHVAPALDFAVRSDAAGKTSLVRHERWFRREGELSVEHLTRAGEIEPHLDEFFEQHVARWAPTPHPSLFLDRVQRDFYRRVVRSGLDALRFTRVTWDGRPIAFHLGFLSGGSYLWYKPSFDIALARRSPGQVLIRQLLLAAAAEGASTFDLGLGDEPFKQQFATRARAVRTWGLYPR
jgi:CelD/BcsL family acetyltransferase involved in cellulose biosynthesis